MALMAVAVAAAVGYLFKSTKTDVPYTVTDSSHNTPDGYQRAEDSFKESTERYNAKSCQQIGKRLAHVFGKHGWQSICVDNNAQIGSNVLIQNDTYVVRKFITF